MEEKNYGEIFSLFGKAKGVFHAFAVKNQMNFTEIRALRIIKRNEKSSEHKDLHLALNINKSAVSQMLGSLEERELIVRSFNKVDRRKIDIVTTEKGNNMLQDVLEFEKLISKKIFDKMGKAQAEIFFNSFENFIKCAKEVNCEIIERTKINL